MNNSTAFLISVFPSLLRIHFFRFDRTVAWPEINENKNTQEAKATQHHNNTAKQYASETKIF